MNNNLTHITDSQSNPQSNPHNETGMLTSIWGSCTWKSLHCISFTYPDNPTESDKKHYRTYFETLKYVLPCCLCRKHYTQHTKIGQKFEINDKIFTSRDTLTKWLYELHTEVDESVGIRYDITYQDVFQKYNSFIADCDMSSDKKRIAFKNSYDQEAPFVIYKLAKCFSEYAKSRGLVDFDKKLKETKEKFKNKRDENNNISDDWIKRNEECWEIIKYMRTNSIIGFETTEINHNLPTIEELKLLQLMSTTLNIRSLKHMIEKLGFKDISSCIE